MTLLVVGTKRIPSHDLPVVSFVLYCNCRRPPEQGATTYRKFVIYYGWYSDHDGKLGSEIERIIAVRPEFIISPYYTSTGQVNLRFVAIEKFHEAGVKVLVYIATGNGNRELEDVLKEIKTCLDSGAYGVMLDEVAMLHSEWQVDYYKEIYDYTKSFGIEQLVNMTMPKASDIYLLGRSIHFPIALEGALKMKELAYVHAEGIAAGELKHGPLALMDKNAVVFVLNPDDKTYSDTLSSAHEVKARGAKIIGISNVSNDVYDAMIEIPKMDNELLYPLVEIIPLQLFSYYLALHNNADPDFPRNLPKSVTVR